MQCQQCKAELLPDARYCHVCAWEVHPHCASCNTDNPPGSKFCYNCGTELGATSEPDEIPILRSRSVCPRCNERNEPSSAYCFSCGLPLESVSRSSGQPPSSIPAFVLGKPGGFWIRLVAYVIDALVLVAVFAIVWPLVSGEPITEYWSSPEPSIGDLSEVDYWEGVALTGGDWFSWAVDLVYYTVAVGVWATTIGKRPFRLYVVRTDGSKVGFGRALGRYLAYFLSAVILGIGFIMIAFRSDKRGLHDLICGTVVIQR